MENAGANERNGHHNGREVRYGVVGLGWFAQAAILPAFRHAKKNSRLVALFSRTASPSPPAARGWPTCG